MSGYSPMMTTKKNRIGLVLSGGGSRGAYHIGVIQYLADRNIRVDAVAGASIGALNGAILAVEANLKTASERLEEIWKVLAENGPSNLGINIEAFLALQFLKELIPVVGTEPLREVINLCNFSSKKLGLLDEEYSNKLLTKYLSLEALKVGLPLYVSVYRTKGALKDLKDVILAVLHLKNTQPSDFIKVQSRELTEQRDVILASAALPLIFEARLGFADGGMGSFIDAQGNTPAYPLVHIESCSHIIVTHLDNGSLWDRYRYNSSNVILLEIRPKESMDRQGWKDLINFDANSIQYWIKQGYEDAERCLKNVSYPIMMHRAAITTTETRDNAMKKLENDGFYVN